MKASLIHGNELRHIFWQSGSNPSKIFNGVNSIKGLITNIKQGAEDHVPASLTYSKGSEDFSKEDLDLGSKLYCKYLGDAFEGFVEVYLKSIGSLCIKLPCTDERKNIYLESYDDSVQSGNDDNGVDGYGTDINGNTITFQMKFCSNPMKSLTAGNSNVDNILKDSWKNYGVPTDATDRMVLITTSKVGLHSQTERGSCMSSVSTINLDELSEVLDGATELWKNMREWAIFSDTSI